MSSWLPRGDAGGSLMTLRNKEACVAARRARGWHEVGRLGEELGSSRGWWGPEGGAAGASCGLIYVLKNSLWLL